MKDKRKERSLGTRGMFGRLALPWPTACWWTGPGSGPVRSLSCQKGGDPAAPSGTATLLRLHPPYQAYLRHRPPLPVRLVTSGTPNSGGVTGGVYKARERIHRAMLMRDY